MALPWRPYLLCGVGHPLPKTLSFCEDQGIRPKLSAIMRRPIYLLDIPRREHPGCGLGYSHSVPLLANLKAYGWCQDFVDLLVWIAESD